MLLYILLFILLLLGFVDKRDKKLGKLIIFLMFLVSFFRGDSVGIDTWSYAHPSLDTESYSGIRVFEVLYHFSATSIVPYVQHGVIFLFSIITFVFLYLSAKRFKVDPIVVFLFFFIFGYFDLSLNICRQFAAASVLLYAYSFLGERGKTSLWFFPLVLFAATIHSSSLFMLILFPLRFIDLSRVNKWIFVALGVASIYYGLTILDSKFMMWALAFDIGDDIQSYSHYFEQTDLIEHSTLGIVFTVSCIVLEFFILYRMCYVNKNDDPQYRVVFNLFFVSILLTILFSNLYGNLGRLRYSVSVIDCIAVAYYLQSEKKVLVKQIVLFSLIILYGALLYKNLASNAYKTVPYEIMSFF